KSGKIVHRKSCSSFSGRQHVLNLSRRPTLLEERNGHEAAHRSPVVDPGDQSQPAQCAHPLEGADPANCGEHQSLWFRRPRAGGRNAYPDRRIRPLEGGGAPQHSGDSGCPTPWTLRGSEAALALADNKSGDNAGWDRARLAIELPDLAELLIKENLNISLTGFSPAEIDQLL